MGIRDTNPRVQISCPRCGSLYEVDDRLLPRGGAPVQCTHCAHVFTAGLPSAPASSTRIFGRSPLKANDADGDHERDTGEDDAPDHPEQQPPPQRERTQIYGKKSAQAGAPSSPTNLRSTMVFGTQTPSAPSPATGASSEAFEERESLRNTQIFGIGAQPAGGVQRAGPRVVSGHSASSRHGASRGASPLSAEQGADRLPPVPTAPAPVRGSGQRERTQPAALPPTEPPARDPLRTTQLFGSRPGAIPTSPAITAQTLLDLTLPPDAKTLDAEVQDDGASSPSQPPPATSPEPEPPFIAPGPLPVAAEPAFTRALAPAAVPRLPPAVLRPSRRRTRSGTWAWLLLLVLLGLTAAAGLYLYREYASSPQPPAAEAIAAHEAALRAVRRDDAASLAQAAQQLEAISSRWPGFHEARVTHLVAVLFLHEDVGIRQALAESQREALEAERVRWAEEVERVWKALGTSGIERADPLQWARAQAVYGGVRGTDAGLRMSEAYKALGGGEGWAEVAYAEYTLNAQVAPQSWQKARQALESARGEDPSWTRLYVMSGRLALKERDADAAITALESARTLNGEHETARLLLEQARTLRGQIAADR